MVELLVVVVLIGILAAVAVPMFSGTSNKAKMNAETNAILTDIRTRQEQYAVEMGRYFTTADTMGVPQANLNGTKGPWQTAGVTSWAPLKVAPSITDVACTYMTRGGGRARFRPLPPPSRLTTFPTRRRRARIGMSSSRCATTIATRRRQNTFTTARAGARARRAPNTSRKRKPAARRPTPGRRRHRHRSDAPGDCRESSIRQGRAHAQGLRPYQAQACLSDNAASESSRQAAPRRVCGRRRFFPARA
ncbi:MAG: hypothetical protein IPL79_07005 [Myxococcales bacterium]|nr:hypothetical protein [Myxococcales bacterium]